MGEPALSPIERFELAGSSDDGSTLRFDAALVPGPIDGKVLEAQYAVGARYLLVLSDDVPFEERLVFHLFDARPELVDSLEFGAPYTAGMFRVVATTDAPGLVFTFEGEQQYELRVLDEPRRFVPAIAGVRRRGGPLHPHQLELRPAGVQR